MKKLCFVVALMLAIGVQAEPTKGQARQFEDLDADGNGSLNSEEYSQLVKTRFERDGKSGWEDAGAKQFRNKDADKDGTMTIEEFVTKPTKK